MNEMRAIVLSLHGSEAEITPVGGNGCGHCASGKGCGSGKLSQLFCSSKQRTFKVSNAISAQVGDEVNVGLPDGVLLRNSMLMYVLPLTFMLAASLLASSFFENARDAAALLGAVAGLLAGFIVVRLLTKRSGMQAVVRSVVNAAGS
ncbi:MAG: SoxR reducing system RseC family protein [Gammaproteobacteria bacterium]|nr:SoxR reducing system RseC family protein [Gammaproteobacteria bacterium]MBU1447121.1 SoxR reducing system RseC family protein [Gammaproteobacteria bacterium]MDD5470334.1 SoxR reducing system RseC family protein [Sideroxydans sp.]